MILVASLVVLGTGCAGTVQPRFAKVLAGEAIIGTDGLEASIPRAGLSLRLVGGREMIYSGDAPPKRIEDLHLIITNNGQSEIRLSHDSALMLYYVAGDPNWVPTLGDPRLRGVQHSLLESEVTLPPGQEVQLTFPRGPIRHCLWLSVLRGDEQVKVIIQLVFK